MSYLVRRALVFITVVLVPAWIAPGCSAPTSGEPAVIGIQITPGFITVENRTGRPLVGMDVTIIVPPVQYIARVPRMEASDMRVLSLGDFKGRDAGTINPNARRPREVVVTASDPDGMKYEVTVPWTQ
jgi:hypothetical protein